MVVVRQLTDKTRITTDLTLWNIDVPEIQKCQGRENVPHSLVTTHASSSVRSCGPVALHELFHFADANTRALDCDQFNIRYSGENFREKKNDSTGQHNSKNSSRWAQIHRGSDRNSHSKF